MKDLRYKAICGTLACSMVVGILSRWEGKSTVAYLDLVQVPTICYGYTHNVKLGDIKTDTECTALLKSEVLKVDTVLMKHVRIDLEPHQRAAFISWVYNVGEGNLRSSTLLRRLNAGDITGACNELPKWIYAKGRKINGLLKRRLAERAICLGETK